MNEMEKRPLGGVPGLPPAQGLYHPANERDACGMGCVGRVGGKKRNGMILEGIQVLINLTHRGACGCDPETGDGAGVLIQIPHEFFARQCAALGFKLPAPGTYGVGMTFLPVEKHERIQCEGILERIAREEGLTVLGWRDTPVDASAIGRVARGSQPYIQQLFVGAPAGMPEDALERKLYVVRKRAEREILETDVDERGYFYIPSLSARTIIYKGLLLAPQIAKFYAELSDPDVKSALCLVHQRFSTNTFPSWPLAHPYRYIAHNGEINTLRGNVNWMNARQSVLRSPLFGDDLKRLLPIIAPNGSDSANFDNAVELLLQAGRSLPHVMSILIPEAWAGNPHMKAEKRAYYEYHASLMEPWDGPAAIAFTDGRVIGATLDRNGLRPGRYVVTHDDLVVMASEAGVLDIEPERVKSKGRLQPGKMFLSDKPQAVVNYFKQLFAQVTNPPIDPIREEMVMSLLSYIGTERNILEETPENCHTLKLPHPILTNRDLEKLRRVSRGDLLATTLPALFLASEGEAGLQRALDELSRRASLSVSSGYTLLILSDRRGDRNYAPIPSLLALAAGHTRPEREAKRTQQAVIIA